jgi:hypothetical protein
LKAIIASPFLWPPTQLTYAMAGKLVSLLQGLGVEVVWLQGPQTLRDVFDFAVANHPDATLIFYMGHANPDAFLGEDVYGVGMLPTGDSGKVRQRLVVGLPACLSAQQLGPALVQGGVLAFVGSQEDMYAQWPEAEHDYMSDWVDYTLTFYKSLAESLNSGANISDAVAKALKDYQDRCTYYMSYYQENFDTWPNADFYYVACRQNRDFVIAIVG